MVNATVLETQEQTSLVVHQSSTFELLFIVTYVHRVCPLISVFVNEGLD